ncbi:MAG: hypothetical protein N2111_14030 [Candidatus Sumerlaeaceae bacterium]|nr:hypothetical protein [Candidatus Sumerlaeaceae bacterium]
MGADGVVPDNTTLLEGVFASLKGHLGCKRAAYGGLDRGMLQMTFGIPASSLTRAVALQQETFAQ